MIYLIIILIIQKIKNTLKDIAFIQHNYALIINPKRIIYYKNMNLTCEKNIFKKIKVIYVKIVNNK